MEFPIQYPGFEGKNVSVQYGLSSMRLFVNGVRVKRVKGVYIVTNNSGIDVPVRLRLDLLDMGVPKVTIDNQRIKIAEPLTKPEKIVTLLPLALLLVGGAIGGAIGATASILTSRMFHSPRSSTVKYILAVAILLSTCIVYLIFAGLLRLLIANT